MHLLNTVTTAIARLLGLTATVRLTQTAGLAHQEPTTQLGKETSAQTSKRQRASTRQSQKPELAQSTTLEPKRGKKKPTAPVVATAKQSKATGSKSQTTAPRSRPHAKSPRKVKA